MVTEIKEKKFVHFPKWEEYVLRKMNQLYTKSELCDVTLRFQDNDTVILAHKVILKACSGFFDVLPQHHGMITLHMPKDMKPQHVKALVNCMYTGKLEYLAEEKNMIGVVAKHLGMSYVIEVLQKQVTPLPNQKNDVRMTQKKIVRNPNSEARNLFVKATSAPKEVPIIHQPTTSLPPPHLPETPPSSGVLPGKKLPIWKQRTTVHLPEEFFHSTNKKLLPPPAVIEPKPTRFEWPEEEKLPEAIQSFSMHSFENLSYDSEVIITPCHDPKPVISEDSIERMPSASLPQPPPTPTLGKRTRVSEVIRGSTEEDDDYDDGHFESIHDIDDDGDDDDSIAANNEAKPNVGLATPPKPILKTFSSPSPSKKVRFAVSSEPKTPVPIYSQAATDAQVTATSTPLPPSPSVANTSSTASVATISTNISNPGNPVNHAKIINELLKKYPELTKNKNIKVKIQSGASPMGPPTVVGGDKDGKGQTKVQFIVMKSDLNNIKKETKEPPNGAENTTGPWTCVPCADDNGPMQFETYYKYRKHLQEIHNERIDARICEHCGFKSSKRNLHLYHLYTKHNINPPRNIHFPKCDQCNYIALSESLLIKHRSNHTGMAKEFICRLCNAAFKSHGALMGHMQTNLHQTDQGAKKDYECEYCSKIFNRNINLKAHIRTCHQEESIRKMYDDEDKVEDPPEVEVSPQEKPEKQNQNVMEVIEVPVFDSVAGGNKTIYLPQGMILTETPSVPLMPSSESEAMSNVATGIATSINITDRNIPNDVLVIDGGPEIILRGGQSAYVVNPDGYTLQEYIVPEIMSDSGQVYTTALVSSAPTTGITYVNTDNISIISSSDHTYADGMKINGHVSSGTPVSIVTSVGNTPQVQTVSQANPPIIVQEPIIVNADWMQTIATSQSQNQTQDIISQPMSQNGEILSSQPIPPKVVEIISPSVTQITHSTPQGSDVPQDKSPTRTAQTLVSDWADLDDDNQDDSQDDDDSERKPSRPTIDLEVNSEIDI